MYKKKETLIGYAFVAPALISFFVLVAFPFFFSIFLAFTKWNFLSGFKGIQWVGLENFKNLLEDKLFIQAIKNTFFYAITTVPVSIVISLILAYILNGKIFLRKFLRMCFFIPYISSIVALAAVFKFLFREEGPINDMLMKVNMISEPMKWLTNPSLSRVPIVLILIWSAIGFELIVYMAAIQNVPKELYEAADIDGANKFQRFRYVTFPHLKNVSIITITLVSIWTFNNFDNIYMLTKGGPAQSTEVLSILAYNNAFFRGNISYASAMATVMLVIMLIASGVYFKVSKYGKE